MQIYSTHQKQRTGSASFQSLRTVVLAVATIAYPVAAVAQMSTVDQALPMVAGAATNGGLVSGSHIVRVTTLADSGLGSLRAALVERSPKVIVFDVGGVIDLRTDLRISAPNVTIAGQTAPHPGILIRGAKIRIVAADVVIQHVSVHPIFRSEPSFVGEIDAISIGECDRCRKQVADIRLENVSAGWANDEVIGVWGGRLQRITIRNSIIAEGLNEAGHPKKRHSMGMLIGDGVQTVEVVGNLFASNVYRSPVLGAGASGFVANNFIHNPGEAAMHLYSDPVPLPTRASFVSNVITRGPSSSPHLTALVIPAALADPQSPARVFARDNHCCSDAADPGLATKSNQIPFSHLPPVTSNSWRLMPARDVPAWVLRYAGSRPADRSPIDARILAYVAAAGGKVINNPSEVGGYPEMPVNQRSAHVPDEPFAPAPNGLTAGTRLEAWLCLRHFEVGGPPTPQCQDQPAVIATALSANKRKSPP